MENTELDLKHSLLDELVRLVKTLRGEHGCPWDKKQTPRNVGVYLLGDVLFHIVFIARIFQERGEFNLSDVAQSITEKMVRRHPHVFGEKNIKSSEEIVENWHKIKLREKKSTAKESSLDSVPVQLPALIRAYRITDRAAKMGFDWTEVDHALENVGQELSGLKTILKSQNSVILSQKLGDLLFSIANIARFFNIHPETALAGSNKKFELRFRKMEEMVAESGRDFDNISLEEKALIWEKVKKIVR